mgnify:FL=1
MEQESEAERGQNGDNGEDFGFRRNGAVLVPIIDHRAKDLMRHNPVMQRRRGAGKGIGRDNHEYGGRQQREKHANRAERNASRAKADPEPAPRGKPFHDRTVFNMMTLPLRLLTQNFTKSLQSMVGIDENPGKEACIELITGLG